ncbi:MAG TPA: glycosyltransferase family 9 protein [Gemmatimonadaceae bacterium]|nr:glycosyltransferase family 9 protein [Gemmatimonadaceae bacterium]
MTPPSLVIQTSFLGDVVLTTPLIARLAERGPVDVVTTAAGAALLSGNPAIRRVVPYDKRGDARGVGGLQRIARKVRAADRGAVAYCVQGSIRTATLAVAARYRVRIGFDRSAGRWLYTERAPYRADRHHAERILRLTAGEAPLSETALHPRLYPGDAERADVDALLRQASVSPATPLLALAPGSIWATKRWPYFPELARRLSSNHRVVVIGSAADGPLAREVATAAGAGVIDATGRLSLLGSAELIRRAALLVTNDSAPQHLASAMGTPTLSIFGPTVPAFGFGPLAPGSAVIGHDTLACRPCHAHGPERCPLDHWRCMRELTVETVVTRAAELLAPPRT